MRFICSLLFLMILLNPVLSQNKQGNDKPIDTTIFPATFFDIDEPLKITLEFNVKKYAKKKPEKEYMPAKLIYHVNDTSEVVKEVRIKSRGNFRREYCYLPPFWININKTDIDNSNLSDVKKIKVVTHCKGSMAFSNYLLKEYIAYKIFNIITEYSFKVRLLKVKYVDTGRNNKITNNWAFMIEPEDLLAERLEAYPLKMDKVNYGQTDSITTTTMTFFQYMIGNTDYSVAGRHNVKLLTLKDFTKPELIVIPYDFDFSGLVNTIYAKPSDKINIKKVTERYYYGMCRSDKTYNKIINLYLEKENEIFSYIESLDFLDKTTKKYVVSYLEDFYKEIRKPNFIKNYVRVSCE